MMGNDRVSIEITALDKFSQVFRKMESEVKGTVNGISGQFNNLNGAVAGITGAFSAMGVAVSAGALLGFGKQIINTADELGKMSQKVGVSVEDLSALKYAGDLADVSIEQLGKGLKQLSKNIIEAVSGSKEQNAAFEAMGISIRGAGGEMRSTNDILLDVADVFAGMDDGATKTALAMKLFGRSGADMIPLLNEGKKGLGAMRSELQNVGGVLDGSTSKAAERFNDNLTKMKASLSGIGLAFVKDVLPALVQFTDGVTTIVHSDAYKAITAFMGAYVKYAPNLVSHIGLMNRITGNTPGTGPEPGAAKGKPGTSSVLQSYLDNLESDTGAAAAKKIESINKQIEDQLGKLTKTTLELIDDQAAAWRKEGADRILLEKWVSAEKDKIITDSMAKAFKQLEDDSLKRYEREKQLDEEAAKWKEDQIKSYAEAMAKALEDEVKQAEALASSNKEARDYADAIRELEEALNPIISKDEDLVKAEAALLDGRKKLAELNDQIAVAWAKGNQVAIEGLTQLIMLQTALNAKLADQQKLMEDVAVLTGKIVGFNNGQAIYADDWKKGQYQYQSAAELAKQQMGGGSSPWGEKSGTIYDVNGNPISIPKYASGTDYVPRTGPAIVHQGERIIPAGKNAGGAPITVSGGITISLPNVTRADDYPAIARGVWAELRKLSGWKL